jgi:alpha-tubulin suppressor-like RCC1 family protein
VTVRTSVQVDCATPGASLYYTLNGQDPTSADRAVTPGEEILIDRSVNLRVRSFVPNELPSDVTSAWFHAQPNAEAHFVTPGGGTSLTNSAKLTVRPDGTVWVWGATYINGYQSASPSELTRPTQTTAISGVCGVACGFNHSLFLKQDGTVWASGTGIYGALGNGSSSNRQAPVQVTGLTDVVQIGAGDSFSMALKSDGTVWAWGYNGSGQLGRNNLTNSSVPVQVLNLTDIVSIAVGRSHAHAIKDDGTVYGWGFNGEGCVGDDTLTNRKLPVQVFGMPPVVSISSWMHSTNLALCRDGTVWGWGQNADGEIGDGTVTRRKLPIQVTTLTDVTALAVGRNSMAVTRAGDVYAWSRFGAGFLGFPSTVARYLTPTLVPSFRNARTVFPGATIAQLNDGSLLGWGANDYGQVGDGTNTVRKLPTRVKLFQGSPMVETARDHVVALKSDGTVWSWGLNDYGQFGAGATGGSSYVPTQAVGVTGAVKVAAGDHHTLALLADGTLRAWGRNTYGTLGDGTNVDRNSAIVLPSLANVVAIAAGDDHSVALTDQGYVYTWGRNDVGQIGDGTFTSRNTPTLVTALAGVVAISAGDDHSFALLANGSVFAWGGNSFGQIGDGSFTDRPSPVAVTSLGTDIRSVIATYNFSLALKSDGSVLSWGENTFGQLGNGGTAHSATPAAVSGLPLIRDISGGFYHALALAEDGSVWTWGLNDQGQLGDNTTVNSSTPVRSAFGGGAFSVGGGRAHSVLVKPDGTVWTWGFNGNGELGDSDPASRAFPEEVTGFSLF